MRYRVYGQTKVTVTIDVNANSEEDAYTNASDQLYVLDAYVGNGGEDKLVGVYGEGRTVSSEEEIAYDFIELLNQEDEEED